MRKSKGFTLAELLIVVAIIAVLVAISIPVFADQLHKAKVASDMSNVRSYYSKLQYDFIQTEVYDDTKENEYGKPGLTFFEIDGNTINLTVGYLWIAPEYAENLMLRYNVQKKDWQKVNCTTTDKEGMMTISTALYTLTVNKKDGSITVADKNGRKIVI